MKSPIKYNWFALKTSAVIGIFIALAMLEVFHYTYGWDLQTFLSAFAIYLGLLASGFFISISFGRFLNRPVDHPVAIIELEVGRRYWLNGETWAYYLGQNNYTGKYKFHIYGLNTFEMPPTTLSSTPAMFLNIFLRSRRFHEFFKMA